MEITNISGPDVVPTGFSSQPPREEQPVKTEEPPVNRRPESSENNSGTRIDTYA
jgi:hypothetical protein